MIDSVVANDAPPAAAVAPMGQLLGDGYTADYLTTQYMRVPRNVAAQRIEDYISPPPKVQLEGVGDESCMYELIIRLWGASIRKQYAAGQFAAIRKGGRFDYTPLGIAPEAPAAEEEWEADSDDEDDVPLPPKREVPIVAIAGALPEITVSTLRAFFAANGVPMGGDRVGLDGLRFFCRAFNISLDVYDAYLQLDSAMSVTRRDFSNRRVKPSHVAVAVKDGHVLQIDNDKGLFRKAEENRAHLEPVGFPSPYYRLAKEDDVIVTKLFHIDQLEEIMALDFATIPRAKDRTSVADIRINEPLERVADMCLMVWRVTPRLRFSKTGRVVVSVEIIVDGVLLRFRNPKTPGSHQLALSQYATAAYAARLSERTAALRSSLINAANMSELNPYGSDWFKVGKRGPLVGILSGVDPKATAFEADAANAHISVVHKLEMFPKFCASDYPEVYDGHPIEDYTNYLLCRHTNDGLTWALNTLLDQTQGRIWGYELKEAWPQLRDVCTITQSFRPFQLVPNKSMGAIEALLTDDVLTLPDVKNSFVITGGSLGKKWNRNSDSRVFALEGEARYFASLHPGSEVHPYLYNIQPESEGGLNATASTVWVCEPGEYRTELVGNFVPIHDMILSGCRMILFRTILRLEAEGHKILALNTDVVFAEGVRVSEPFNKRDPANLGRIGFNPKALPSHRNEPLFAQLDWETDPPHVYNKEPRNCTYFMHGEDSNGLCKAIKIGKDLLVLGAAPGVGKTTTILKAFNSLSGGVKKKLAVVPSNARVAELRSQGINAATADELRAQGIDACTYAWYLETFVKNGELVAQTAKKRQVYRRPDGVEIQMAEFAFILFDEAATLPIREWTMLVAKIKRLRRKATPPRMCATADTHQLPPIEHNVNPCVNEKDHITRRLFETFPSYVELKDPKRWKRPECKALVLQLKEILFGDESRDPQQRMREAMALFPSIQLGDAPVGARFVSYLRKTRARLNRFAHERAHPGVEFPVGVHLVYFSHNKVHEGATLYKNATCVVDSVTDTHVQLHDLAEAAVAFQVTLKQARDWFVYSHAATCHSAQGATWDAPICIADWWFPRVTPEWLYVALTRNRDTRTVRILGRPPTPEQPPLDLATLASRIAGHNRVDAEAGRLPGDLTVGWVVATHKLQEGQCAICHEEIELPRVGVAAGLDQASIDRADSDLGHSCSNCQLTCRSCNFAKKDN